MSDGGSIRAKVHLYQGQMVIAICDSELIGRVLDNRGVPFNVSESFYGGPIVSEEELVSLLSCGGNMNILGKRAVQAAIDAGIARMDQIMEVADVPHVQVYRIKE